MMLDEHDVFSLSSLRRVIFFNPGPEDPLLYTFCMSPLSDTLKLSTLISHPNELMISVRCVNKGGSQNVAEQWVPRTRFENHYIMVYRV